MNIFRLLLLMFVVLPGVGLARPNIVVLLVDDAGLMDFGGYGGEANTPNINTIADRGVRFSNYHSSPLCSTSRAMLLTGLNNHRTGVATIPEVLTEEQRGSAAYALHLLPGVKTVADLLREEGYQTYMTGKWHLGRGPGDLPDSHGFDRSFVLDASGADNWEQKPFLPFYEEAPWFEDGKPAQLPEDFYSSRFIVDQMIDYLETRADNLPFFSYLAFQAIHIPVQAPREFTDRYAGVYADGWDMLRQRRFETAMRLGLVPEGTKPPAAHPKLREWDSLSNSEKVHYERSMMVNAGMLEAMDHHIGRFAEYLESEGELDNTVFIITSDNGPEFGDPAASLFFRLWMSQNGYHIDPEKMGEKGSMGAIGPEWASVAAIPGALFKMYASEGGTRVPFIVSGPGVAADAGFKDSLSFVTDITPTLLALADVEAPDNLDGRSLVPVLTGEKPGIYTPGDRITMEVAGNAAVFQGDFKLTRNTRPHGDSRWRLHNLKEDPAEAIDLSDALPAQANALLSAYQQYALAMGVIEVPPDFDVMEQVAINARKVMLSQYRLAIVIVFATLVGIAILLLRRRVNRRR